MIPALASLSTSGSKNLWVMIKAGAGTSARINAPTHHRVRSCHPAILPQSEQTAASPAPTSGYGPLTTATSWKTGRISPQDFPLQPNRTLRCPAGQSLSAQERRREADGSLHVVYAASIRSCRPCPLGEQCQWQGRATKKPRHVSVLLHPLAGIAPNMG